MKLKNKNVLVLGAGKSGTSAKTFLEARGATVNIHDDNDTVKHSISPETAPAFDLTVISPGVSINHPLAKAPIIGELELGFGVPHRKIIAITGTNGKTTVSNMINAALRGSILCGNVGIPVTSVTKQIRWHTAVAEVSSFQLESAQNFRPNIAVLLNISQDHLERHKTMQEYIHCKAQIFKNQKKHDKLILNYDDENCRKIAHRNPLYFSTTTRVRGIYVEENNVMLNLRGRAKKLFSLNEVGENRPHAIQNILATTLVCKLMHASTKSIIAAIRANTDGENQRHRIEFVADNGTLQIYNDSKSTNIASTLAACNSFKSPINLILGGLSKGQNFTELFAHLPSTVENIFVFGNCAEEIIAASTQADAANTATWDTQPEIVPTNPSLTKCTDLREATHRATQTGQGPRIILLSPACSSFDMFKNYQHRGDQFVQIVKELLNK